MEPQLKIRLSDLSWSFQDSNEVFLCHFISRKLLPTKGSKFNSQQCQAAFVQAYPEVFHAECVHEVLYYWIKPEVYAILHENSYFADKLVLAKYSGDNNATKQVRVYIFEYILRTYGDRELTFPYSFWRSA